MSKTERLKDEKEERANNFFFFKHYSTFNPTTTTYKTLQVSPREKTAKSWPSSVHADITWRFMLDKHVKKALNIIIISYLNSFFYFLFICGHLSVLWKIKFVVWPKTVYKIFDNSIYIVEDCQMYPYMQKKKKLLTTTMICNYNDEYYFIYWQLYSSKISISNIIYYYLVIENF